VEHLIVPQTIGRLLALLANIVPTWQYFFVANALAYSGAASEKVLQPCLQEPVPKESEVFKSGSNYVNFIHLYFTIATEIGVFHDLVTLAPKCSLSPLSNIC
jgi:hypothetical protein